MRGEQILFPRHEILATECLYMLGKASTLLHKVTHRAAFVFIFCDALFDFAVEEVDLEATVFAVVRDAAE
jgi:hypothetical protein